MNKRMAVYILRILMIMIMAFSIMTGCGLRRTVQETPETQVADHRSEAEELIGRIKRQNEAITAFKGVGRIRYLSQGKLHVNRGAWAGIKPNKFRIEILNPARQPAASIASDGQWLCLLSHHEGRFHKERAEDADLSKLIAMPVTISEIITLLSGGVPLRPYQRAYLKPNPNGKGWVIVLKKRWRGVVEKFFLDEKKERVRQVEVYNLGGLVYRVNYQKQRSFNGVRLPQRIVVSNRDEVAFQMDVDRYWVNVPVSTAMFQLKPPPTARESHSDQ